MIVELSYEYTRHSPLSAFSSRLDVGVPDLMYPVSSTYIITTGLIPDRPTSKEICAVLLGTRSVSDFTFSGRKGVLHRSIKSTDSIQFPADPICQIYDLLEFSIARRLVGSP